MAQMDLTAENGLQTEQQPAGQQQAQGTSRNNGLQRSYQVREVTNYQASWTEQSPGKEGKFTVQLILDNGVQEHILHVCAEDLDVMLSLLKRSHHTMFDVERCVLMFSNLDAA
jgi:ribonuclease D